MNKQDITIVSILVAILIGWMIHQNKLTRERAAAYQQRQAEAAALSADAAEGATLGSDGQAAPDGAAPSGSDGQAAPGQRGPGAAEAPATPGSDGQAAPDGAAPSGSDGQAAPDGAALSGSDGQAAPGQNPPAAPEQFAVLDNGELAIVLSTRGGAIASVTLAGYRQSLDKDSPALTFDFGDARALAISGVPGANADFSILSASATNAVLSCALASGATLTRTFTLLPGYQVALEDALSAPAGGGAQASMPEAAISIGSLSRQSRGSTAVLSVDNLPVSAPDGKAPKVLHWERKRLLSKLFTGGSGSGFGCASAPDGAQFPPAASASYREPQRWVAIKTRFFAMALAGESAGYSVTASRSQERGPLSVKSVSASMLLPAATLAPGETLTRSFRLYIGPKKLSVLRSFAENSAEIMEFGTFKWLCVILIPILNGLNAVFHNYGVAIIVLTILVRLLFWPLTRKSNESMKKMGAIQPQLREIQEKFKGDPQKLQQETMRLYRENKVNPMSSCLPMLIQIPVFIALFVVLRTATELRFAPFLWIRDLSEPENILAGAFPGLPALNILPFLMAGTMFLQSKFTPSAGDPAQQKMMMWMMPLMMFFMFYSMPSALLLYWTVSQFLAIVQLLRQRRASAAATPVAADGTIDGDALSRQERRRLDRENAAR